MSLPLSESSSSSGGISGFIYLTKSACIESGKHSGNYASGRISLGPSMSQLDLGGMTEEELVARIQSLAIENDELRAVLQHNNGLLENHFKDLSAMQATQRQRSEHLTKAHEKAKEVVRRLRERNRSLEKDLHEAHQKLAEMETQLSLQEASREESVDQEEAKDEKIEPMRELVQRLKEENKTLAGQNHRLLEHINKVRTISESERELIASVASSGEWSSSDLVSSEFDSAQGKVDSTDPKINTELEIVKVDLAQVRVESEQKDLFLQELRSEKENLASDLHQREVEMKQNNDLLKAAKEEVDERCKQLGMEVANLQLKNQQLRVEKEQVIKEKHQESQNRKVNAQPEVMSTHAGSQTDMLGAELEQRIVDLTKQLTQKQVQHEDLQTELNLAKAEAIKLKEQVELFNARYKEAEENAKAFDLGSEDIMKQKLDAMKQQLWKYQQKEGEIKDKEEALLEKEGNLAKLEQDNNELSQKLASAQLQLTESQQKETALQEELNVQQQELDSSKEALEEALQTQRNLQTQLEDNARANTQVDECQAQITALQQQLTDMNAESDSRLEQLQQDHEEEKQALNQQLEDALDEHDRAEHLRAQVCQLIQENHSLEAKVQEISEENSNREELYSQRRNRMEQDHQTQCQQKEIEMEALHKQLATVEEEFKKGKTQQELSRVSFEQLQAQHDKVTGDYNLLLQNFQATMKTEKKRKECSSAEILNLQTQVDNLTAQVITAEEAIQKKDDECNTAKERLQELSLQLERMTVMQTQLEVYQADFGAEREAREREHAEKNRLREENHQLQLEMRHMQDELDRHNNDQLSNMRLRHSQEGRSPPPQTSSGYQGPEANSPGWFGLFTRRGPGDEANQNDVAGNDVPAGEWRGAQPAQEEDRWSCPQCQQRFPDFDSLQMHAVECGGQQQQQQQEQENRPWCPICGNYFPDVDTLEIHVQGCGN